MPAYVIAFVDIHDPARFAKEYVLPIAATLKSYGGRILAASDEARIFEGPVPPGRTVIIEFSDIDRANDWYLSDVYAPLISLRKTIATTSLIALPGVSAIRD